MCDNVMLLVSDFLTAVVYCLGIFGGPKNDI